MPNIKNVQAEYQYSSNHGNTKKSNINPTPEKNKEWWPNNEKGFDSQHYHYLVANRSPEEVKEYINKYKEQYKDYMSYQIKASLDVKI